MLIDVLILRPDGTQQMERREVPDDFFDHGGEDQAEADTAQ